MKIGTVKKVLIKYFHITNLEEKNKLIGWRDLRKLIERRTDFKCRKGLYGSKDIIRFVLTRTDYKQKPFIHLVKDGKECVIPQEEKKTRRVGVVSYKVLKEKNLQRQEKREQEEQDRLREAAEKRGFVQTPIVILRRRNNGKTNEIRTNEDVFEALISTGTK